MKAVSPSVRPARRNARRLTLWLSLLLVTASLSFITHGRLQADEGRATAGARRTIADKVDAPFVAGNVLVRFRSETAAKTAAASVAALRLADGGDAPLRLERFEGSDLVKGLRLAHVAPADTLAAIAALNARPDVLYAEPDYILHVEATPNDPSFSAQYGLNKIGAPAAWDIQTGNDTVVVGVIDEGIDVNHPDLQPNIWRNLAEANGVAGVDDDGNGFVDDVNGYDFTTNTGWSSSSVGDLHATHVAGTVGARGNNGIGVTGVNWQVSLMSLKVLGATGGSTSTITRAYAYAVMQRQRGVNLRVLNNSYGGRGFSQTALDAIAQLNQAGILFVAAAGNDGLDNFNVPHFPSSYDVPNLIAVAATDSADQLVGFSNFGARAVNIGAPGRSILSTLPNGTYGNLSGTSMSSPHVAGAAALLCAQFPNITLAQLRGALLYSGDAIPALQGKSTTGRRLNVFKSLQSGLENDVTAPAAISNLRITAQSGRSVTLSWTAPGDDGNAGQAADYDFFFVKPNNGTRILLSSTIQPAPAGTTETVTVDVPYRNFSGTIQLTTYDNAGNSSTASVPVSLSANPGTDPYIVNESAAAPIVNGTALNFRADDAYQSYSFPAGFSFPFYGQTQTSVVISTNGVLYFTPRLQLPVRDDGTADDSESAIADLAGLKMIAGMWDDLRTDVAGGDVFVSQPDNDRLVFHWEGQTFNGAQPISFDIELRRDGTIQTRYGAGNTNLSPVVGVSGGDFDPYVITSHTAEFPARISLSNAQTVTFAPRTAAAGATVQFAAPSVSVNEAVGNVSISVTRTGDVSQPASVGYQTIDDPAAVRCDVVNGTAYARCDYATTVDTLNFAANEAAKNITIPIIDDGHFEGPETFQVTLLNPSSGLSLNPPSLVTVTIQDNDTATTPNPIFTTPFFVRQHYLDFLAREPEPTEPFTALLNGCANVNNTDPNSPSAGCDRINVSGQFFGSPEFKDKGVYVIVAYRVAFNRLPQYTEFVQDLRSISGATAQEVFAKRAAFAANFVQRPEFTALYPPTLPNAAFVDALLGRYSLTQISAPDPANPDGSVKVTLTRADLVNGLTAGTLSRAQVFRAIVQSDQVSLQAEVINAFVAAQYYGYLRRTPDTGGFQGWVNYLAAHPGDFRTMVNGFVNSIEYRLRFGAQ